MSQRWSEAARVFSSDILVRGWVQPVWLWVRYFTSVEFWFPHPQREDSSSTYLMRPLRGLNGKRDETLTHPQSGTKKSVVWSSFITFSLFPPSLGITDEHFFQAIQQLIYHKTLPQKSFGGTDRGQVAGSWRVQFTPRNHTEWAHSRGSMPNMERTSSDKRIYSQPFTCYYHNVISTLLLFPNSSFHTLLFL